MRYALSLPGGIFLLFLNFGPAFTASTLRNLHARDSLEIQPRKWEHEGFSRECGNYKWDGKTCILEADCSKNGVSHRTRLDLNTCLANFVPKDATPENEDSEENLNAGGVQFHMMPLETQGLKKATGNMSTTLPIPQAALDMNIELDFISDPEDWSDFGLMDLNEESSTPEEAAALREFVQAYHTPNALNAEEAARRLMSLNEDQVPCDGDWDKGERIAYLLWDVGIEMVQHQVAILVLVDAAMALPRLDATPEQEVRFGAEKLERWRSMEDFWDVWATRRMRYDELRYDRRGPDTEYPGYPRSNAFVARHLVLHLPDFYYTSELSEAFASLVMTLEKGYDLDTSSGSALSSREIEAQVLETATDVHGIIPFLVIAGDILYRYTDRDMIARRFAEAHQENHEHNTSEFWLRLWSSCSERFLWKEEKGDGHEWLTRERWAFWKERLSWMSEQTELKQRTRDEAIMLVQVMTEIEGRGV
ncbi:hypothetical protein B0T20DRAFT_480518 [Sordaria brevicollis]|uniref:Uncharacterized protein n=1 Tax=Sordaria brevicollis TaxID=83679 RepID=A0AAE0PBH5_SORBR|nr:hypothetical protein B0T20DRAFT_480518 [Sordaria brevicollis]